MPNQFRDVFYQSADGLKLHAKVIGPDTSGVLPVLCLPGLTRTADDFDDIARALATDTKAPRKVIAMDYRGRGLSDYDPDPAKYTVPIELGDVLTIAASLGISRAILLGTSRGGLISMALAAVQPQLMAGVILNDIGPALEIDGLMKIKGYIANPPERRTWDEAARGLKELFGSVFPSLSDAEWMAWTRRAFREKAGGGLERTYDLKLSHALDGLDPASPLPQAWDLVRQAGERPADADPWRPVRPALAPGRTGHGRAAAGHRSGRGADQGHAPLLADRPTVDRIVAFCARCDSAEASASS